MKLKKSDWEEKFLFENGRFPYNDEELEDYMEDNSHLEEDLYEKKDKDYRETSGLDSLIAMADELIKESQGHKPNRLPVIKPELCSEDDLEDYAYDTPSQNNLKSYDKPKRRARGLNFKVRDI